MVLFSLVVLFEMHHGAALERCISRCFPSSILGKSVLIQNYEISKNFLISPCSFCFLFLFVCFPRVLWCDVLFTKLILATVKKKAFFSCCFPTSRQECNLSDTLWCIKLHSFPVLVSSRTDHTKVLSQIHSVLTHKTFFSVTLQTLDH